ncbi:cytochrome c oxidase subunit 6A1, mitochondrial-like [Mirounga angustirostris]|uniref:cytochrome c oxidase subunit 6A1, mitochondrial-like n=1 Tax=Mirounga angustirostris TaxID=9716 RepID=UPI00313D5D3D
MVDTDIGEHRNAKGLESGASSWDKTRVASGAHGEEGSARMWKALTYFVALPGVDVSMLNVFLKSRHGEHERPEFVAYPHLRIRSKPFPWRDGNHTLFHNSHMNPLPTGYEDE